MKIGQWARLFLAVAPLLAGCKGFWNAPTTTTTTTGGASGVFYVLNHGTSQIAGYSFAASSTTPTAVTNSPYSLAGTAPASMAISPSGGFLYVGTETGIFVYGIATDGSLSILSSGAAISGDFATTMQVDPSGSWLVETVAGVNALNAIPLDPTTGLVLTGSKEQTVTLPSGATTVKQIAITPASATNQYIFVAMATSGTAVIPFTEASTGSPFGAVTTYKAINNLGADNTIAVDASRPLLYVGETVAFTTGTQTGGLRVFTIGASSALTEVTGSPYQTAGIGPSAILPTTDYVYVANQSVSGSTSGNITGFAITTTGTAYSLTSISTVSAGIATVGLAEDSTGVYVLAVNASGTPDLSVFTFDTTTLGKLDSYATPATGTDPVQAISIVAVP